MTTELRKTGMVVIGALALLSGCAGTRTPSGARGKASTSGGLGDHCGGFIANAPTCQDPLVCHLNPRLPDVGGVCIDPTVSCNTDDDCAAQLDGCQACDDGSASCACENGQCIPHACGGASCQVATDCSGALPHICQACSDGSSLCAAWDCQNNQCVISTPSCPAPLAQKGEHCGGFILNAAHCAAPLVCHLTPPGDAGGVCVDCNVDSDCSGLLPQICEVCADGSSACAHFTCQNNQCVTQTCPPAPPACTMDTDCKGILPHVCQVCTDGSTQCAHFACQGGQCNTVVCQ